MAMRDFIDRLRDRQSRTTDPGPAISGPRALFNRKRSRLLWLKISLPILALGIVGYLTYRSYEGQNTNRVTLDTVENVAKFDAGMKVSGISFEGKSKSERPYSVTAISATETVGNKDLINLDEPQAQIELSDVTWIAVTAEHGVYDRKLDQVDLTGAVTVYHDNGMTFVTEQAAMDMKANTASGSAPVVGSDAYTKISAEGFEMLDDGATVLFKGRSHMEILPKEKGSGG